MPKIAVAIISGAIAWIIGFFLGALFTLPENREMESLVNAKTEMAQQIKVLQTQKEVLQTQKEELIRGNAELQGQIVDLKNRLISAYEVEKKTDTKQDLRSR
jgi:regulator of replication initiation timing